MFSAEPGSHVRFAKPEMVFKWWRVIALHALATALISACGGGNPAAPAEPAVSAQPDPVGQNPIASGPIGLTQLQNFPTLGFSYRYTVNSDGSDPQGPAAPDPTETIGFSYLPAEQAYEIEIPGFARGRLSPQQAGSTFTWNSLSSSASATFQVGLYRPGPGNTELSLNHTSVGRWNDPIYTPLPAMGRTENDGLFAYGVPTANGDVPARGARTYEAVAYGITNVIGGSPMTPGFIKGDALLVFDTSTGGLSGRLRPRLNDGTGAYTSLGEYQLTDIAYSAGGTTFSGKFAVPGSAADGFFEGFFTGPQAAELMVRWQAPFLHPELKASGTMFGIWIGKSSQ